MKASASASFTLKWTAAQTQSAEVKDSREDTCFSKPKDLETVGGLWFFQEWDGLKWVFFKKERKENIFMLPHTNQTRKAGKEGRLFCHREKVVPSLKWCLPVRTVPGPRLPSPSPISREPSEWHFRTTLGECLLAACVSLRLQPHGRHMQEMHCNSLLLIILREGWQSRGRDWSGSKSISWSQI